jgi:dienelactone hydrolase
MAYDPFRRGPHPAGVRTLRARDEARDRSLPIEVWYPAEASYAGQDTADETRDQYELVPGLPPVPQDAVRDAPPHAGSHPVVLFSHGYGSHRRQSTFLTTHLASHGYVVASVDHVGNTVYDVMLAAVRAQARGEVPDIVAAVTSFAGIRPADVVFALDHVLAELGGLADPERVGMAGHSFGGWTTLAVTARERRIRAALVLAPAGGSGLAETNPLARALVFDWGRDVPVLYVVADRDSLLPLPTMHDLFERTRSQKRLVVLRDTDHMHFCDRAEMVHEMFRTVPMVPELQRLAPAIPPFDELAAEAPTLGAIGALGLAHMDAALRADEGAAGFLAADLAAVLAARGVAADVA